MRFVLLFMVVMAVVVAGCKSATPTGDTVVEILQISADCADKEACCQDLCTKFCTGKGMDYAKYTVNAPHCGCWCD